MINQPIKIKKIVLSAAPRLDALSAVFLVIHTKEGKKLFPNAEKASIVFWTGDSSTPPAGLDPQRWQHDGVLFLARGAPHSPFDEHAGPGRDNRMNSCTAALMADYLGISNVEPYKSLVDSILAEDTHANSGENSLPVLVKLWHDLNTRKKLDPLLKLVFSALRAIVGDQRTVVFEDPRERLRIGFISDAIGSMPFPNATEQARSWLFKVLLIHQRANVQFEVALEALKEAKVICDTYQIGLKVKEDDQKKKAFKQCLVVVVESDNPWMQKAVRRHWKNTAVVVVKNSRGNVCILPNAQLKLDMGDVLAGIRVEEQKRREGLLTTGYDDLRIDGPVVGCMCWMSFAGMILNGSHTSPDVEPTKLSSQEIARLILDGISSSFEPSRSAQCKNSVCSSTSQSLCPWKARGYKRCRRVRAVESRRKTSRSSESSDLSTTTLGECVK